MKKRGKIIRDTSLGQGLLSIGGEQFAFVLEGLWKSDVAPACNMVVEVDLSEDNQITAIAIVPDAQLAKEQAAVAVAAAKEKGAQLGSAIVAKFGFETLAAIAILAMGWFTLNTISIQISSDSSVGMSFWKVLTIVNSPSDLMNLGSTSSGAGMYGFLAIIALIGPLAPYFWKDPRAYLGGLLPLAFMLFVGVMIYMGINDGVKEARGAASLFGGGAANIASEMANSMVKEILKAISIGAGAYLSIVASLYFAGKGGIKFFAAKA